MLEAAPQWVGIHDIVGLARLGSCAGPSCLTGCTPSHRCDGAFQGRPNSLVLVLYTAKLKERALRITFICHLGFIPLHLLPLLPLHHPHLLILCSDLKASLVIYLFTYTYSSLLATLVGRELDTLDRASTSLDISCCGFKRKPAIGACLFPLLQSAIPAICRPISTRLERMHGCRPASFAPTVAFTSTP